MYDPYEARRVRRAQRRYYRYSNPLRGLTGGIFIIALIIGFSLNNVWHGTGFLVMLFVGLAFCSLLGSISTLNPRSIYGGIQGFVWMLGLALCFIIGFWPWIMLPVAVTMILGALINPITMGLAGWGFLAASQAQQPQQPVYQPPQEQPGYQPYQEGYQGAPQPTYQDYPQPKQEYEQPQVHYPEQQQELPPMEQH